jgi:hypothetical protein
MQLLLRSLVGRQAEIDRLLGVFAGIVAIQGYFSARNFVRPLGVRAGRAVIAPVCGLGGDLQGQHGRRD